MIDYKYEIKALRNSVQELQEKLNNLVTEYQSICGHTSMKQIKKYYSGGYDYSANSMHYYTCNDCGYSYSENKNHNRGFE